MAFVRALKSREAQMVIMPPPWKAPCIPNGKMGLNMAAMGCICASLYFQGSSFCKGAEKGGVATTKENRTALKRREISKRGLMYHKHPNSNRAVLNHVPAAIPPPQPPQLPPCQGLDFPAVR